MVESLLFGEPEPVKKILGSRSRSKMDRLRNTGYNSDLRRKKISTGTGIKVKRLDYLRVTIAFSYAVKGIFLQALA